MFEVGIVMLVFSLNDLVAGMLQLCGLIFLTSLSTKSVTGP